MFKGIPVVSSFIDFQYTEPEDTDIEILDAEPDTPESTVEHSGDLIETEAKTKETETETKETEICIENETIIIESDDTLRRIICSAGIITGLVALIGVGISIKFYK